MPVPRLKVTILVEEADSDNRTIRIHQGIALDPAVIAEFDRRPEFKYEVIEYSVEKIMEEIKRGILNG